MTRFKVFCLSLLVFTCTFSAVGRAENSTPTSRAGTPEPVPDRSSNNSSSSSTSYDHTSKPSVTTATDTDATTTKPRRMRVVHFVAKNPKTTSSKLAASPLVSRDDDDSCSDLDDIVPTINSPKSSQSHRTDSFSPLLRDVMAQIGRGSPHSYSSSVLSQRTTGTQPQGTIKPHPMRHLPGVSLNLDTGTVTSTSTSIGTNTSTRTNAGTNTEPEIKPQNSPVTPESVRYRSSSTPMTTKFFFPIPDGPLSSSRLISPRSSGRESVPAGDVDVNVNVNELFSAAQSEADAVYERIRSMLVMLQIVLLMTAGMVFIAVILYSVYYIQLIKEIYAQKASVENVDAIGSRAEESRVE